MNPYEIFPFEVEDIIKDYVNGDVAYWKKQFKYIVQSIKEINYDKRILVENQRFYLVSSYEHVDDDYPINFPGYFFTIKKYLKNDNDKYSVQKKYVLELTLFRGFN